VNIKKLFGKREIGESEKTPKAWGKAHMVYAIHTDKITKVCYPVPINLIVGWVLRVWYTARWGLSPSLFDRMILNRLNEARDSIWDSAFECGKHDGATRRENEIAEVKRKFEALEKEYQAFKTQYYSKLENN